MPATSRSSATSALTAMASVVITSFVVAFLYIGRDILIPLALAALFAFLLGPLVSRMEHWLGRVGATLAAVAVLFAIIGGIGWMLTVQVLDLANRLPDYKNNIQVKLQALKMPGSGKFTKLTDTVNELKKDLPTSGTGDQPDTSKPTADKTVAVTPNGGPGTHSLPKPPASDATPIPVQIVETKHADVAAEIGAVISPLIGPLGTGALVLLLLICMLLQKEDLRGRLIRLTGRGNISAATRALDDAAGRVAKYLLMQLIVNATYGLAVFIGLYFIGVPNAIVWGVLATVLRFIPYVGPWVASAFPIAVSILVGKSWAMPLETLGMFLFIELISNNVMEPLLYGSSTGVSSIALIVAAVFWTWLWGPAGLVLATPLTVCLVVMGRHVPRLSVLSVILSDEQALAPHEEFYHRLLTPDQNDGVEFADSYLKANSLTALYDSVFVPVLATVEMENKAGQLEGETYTGVLQEMKDVIEDLGSRPAPPSKLPADEAVASAVAGTPPGSPQLTCRVTCLPVRADRDEIAGAMLTQVLVQHDFQASYLSAKLTSGELLEGVEKDGPDAVCVSVTPPSTVVHARYLAGKLRARFPKLRIVIGLWGATEQLAEATQRLRESGADEVVTTFADANVQLSKHAAALAQEEFLLAPASNETERLAELASLNLLNTTPEPAFDSLTRKVARILNMPIAFVSLLDQDRCFFKSQTGLPPALAAIGFIPRDLSVCTQAIAGSDVFVVEDLARDRRFAKNPVLKEHGLRFYAGAPLRTASGLALGALAVLDLKPRRFSDADKRVLHVMAEEIMETVAQRMPAKAEVAQASEAAAAVSG